MNDKKDKRIENLSPEIRTTEDPDFGLGEECTICCAIFEGGDSLLRMGSVSCCPDSNGMFLCYRCTELCIERFGDIGKASTAIMDLHMIGHLRAQEVRDMTEVEKPWGGCGDCELCNAQEEPKPEPQNKEWN